MKIINKLPADIINLAMSQNSKISYYLARYGSMQILYGFNDQLVNEVCFRRFECHWMKSKGVLYSVLKDNDVFCMESLFNEVESYFKGVFKFNVYELENSQCKLYLVKMTRNKNVPERVAYCAGLIILCILRIFDGEMRNCMINNGKTETPIKDLKTAITIFSSRNGAGHTLNEDLVNITMNSDEELINATVSKYLRTIKSICGKSVDWNLIKFPHLDQIGHNAAYQGRVKSYYSEWNSQTPAYNYLAALYKSQFSKAKSNKNKEVKDG